MRITNQLKFVIVIAVAFVLSIGSQTSVAESPCYQVTHQQEITEVQQQAIDVSVQTATKVDEVLRDSPVPEKSKRGLAILVGTMVGSAALTTYLGAHLPAQFQFASIFLSQVSTLGVFVLGSPIWEPLSSKFRQWAFGVSQSDLGFSKNHSAGLESAWRKTQESYSLNAQMSRNVLSQFLLVVKDNFYQAYRAHTESNPNYAADQIAEAAYRMRILFKDIDPSDHSVATAVQSAFTNHIEVDQDLRDKVWYHLERIDREYNESSVNAYYREVMESWLGSSQ